MAVVKHLFLLKFRILLRYPKKPSRSITIDAYSSNLAPHFTPCSSSPLPKSQSREETSYGKLTAMDNKSGCQWIKKVHKMYYQHVATSILRRTEAHTKDS